MATLKHQAFSLALLTTLLVGCDEKGTLNTVKQTETINITDTEKVSTINEILQNVKWETKKVQMDAMPDYKMSVQHEAATTYHLWQTPNTEQFEIIIPSEQKYTVLPVEASEQLVPLLKN